MRFLNQCQYPDLDKLQILKNDQDNKNNDNYQSDTDNNSQQSQSNSKKSKSDETDEDTDVSTDNSQTDKSSEETQDSDDSHSKKKSKKRKHRKKPKNDNKTNKKKIDSIPILDLPPDDANNSNQNINNNVNGNNSKKTQNNTSENVMDNILGIGLNDLTENNTQNNTPDLPLDLGFEDKPDPVPKKSQNSGFIHEMQVFDKNDVKCKFGFVSSGQVGVARVAAIFTNVSMADEINNFSFMVAVPKYIKLQIKKADATNLTPMSMNKISQKFQLTNTKHNEKPILIKMKITFQKNGNPVTFQEQCQFPPNVSA